MESIWERYYSITKKFSLFVGQWPYQNRNERIFRTSVITIGLLLVIVPQICKIVQCGKNAECIFKIVPPYILMLIIMTKMYTGRFKSSEIKILAERVFINWRRLQSSDEYEIMETYVASTRWLVVTYAVVCILGTAIFLSISVVPHILDIVLPLNESRPILLPFDGYFFVDEKEYFLYIFFYGFILGEVCIMGLIAYDTLIVMFIEHICGVFTVAGFNFERLACEDINVADIVNNDIDALYNRRMAYCVNVHCAALEFAEYLEDIFSMNLGIQLLLVILVLSITLFEVTTNSNNILEAMRHTTYTCAQLVHLFIFCWEGQKLIDHSLQIHRKIYNCTWYKIPIKSQKLILHVMKRSLRSKSISASKIFIFSLQGFTTIVQTSMSYFTMLSSVQ